MFNKILVPLDGSTLAERALEPALTLARQQHSEIILLQVCVYKKIMVPGLAGYGLLYPDQSLEESREEAWQYLESVAERYSFPDFQLELRVTNGDVASSVVDMALIEEADLIVMTTHGYSGLTRWILGSVCERVMASAPCPVLMIRGARPLRKVLITLDGSAISERAMAPGLEIARRLGSKVILLQSQTDEVLNSIEWDLLEVGGTGISRHIQQDSEQRLRCYLEKMAQKYGQPGDDIESVLTSGLADLAILDFVETDDIDLVVMATHGRSGLRRWIYGSVTEKVLRHTPSALLLVRPPMASLNHG